MMESFLVESKRVYTGSEPNPRHRPANGALLPDWHVSGAVGASGAASCGC